MYHRACVSCFRSRALPAEVQVSGDRQVPRLRSECHGGAVAPKFPFFQQKKHGLKWCFLISWIGNHPFLFILVSYHLDLLKVIHTISLVWFGQKKKVYTVKLQRRGSSEKNQKGETKLAGVPWTCATPLKKFNGCKGSLNHLRHKAPPWQTGRVRFRGVSRAHSWGCGSSID